jgi:hypothetical protein
VCLSQNSGRPSLPSVESSPVPANQVWWGQLNVTSSCNGIIQPLHEPPKENLTPAMMPHGAYDDGELEISLAPSANRRANNKRPDASTRRAQNGSSHHSVEPTVPKKQEQRIGAYQVIRTLGEGSFGKVKLAVHRVTNQQVALKIIGRKKLISRDMAGRVEREIEYLQLLRHPHIIKL